MGKLEEYYCKTWTVEFMHVHEDVERNWLISQVTTALTLLFSLLFSLLLRWSYLLISVVWW